MTPEIIIAIVGLISTVLTGGLVYYKQNKKYKDLENQLKEIEVDNEIIKQWECLYQEEKAKNTILENRLSELYKHRKLQSEEISNLKEKLANKEVELAKKDVIITGLNYCKCVVNECNNRKPKRDYETDITTTSND